MRLRLFIILALAAVACVAGCSNKPDPAKDFQIGLNGDNYLWEPGRVAAFFEGDAPYRQSGDCWITLMFQQQTPAQFTTKGLMVRFSSGMVQPGQPVTGGPGQGAEVIYSPAHPIKEKGGTVNEFSSSYGAGTATIVFDEFENRLNGRIKGTLKYAKLYGYFMMINSGERIAPQQPVIIEFYNWPFDLRLDRSPYYQ